MLVLKEDEELCRLSPRFATGSATAATRTPSGPRSSASLPATAASPTWTTCTRSSTGTATGTPRRSAGSWPRSRARWLPGADRAALIPAAQALGEGPAGVRSELVRRGDRLGHDDLGRFGVGADRPDEGLQVRVGHELLEVLDALPFVDDDDVAVADAEPVMQRADGLGAIGDL